MSNNGDYIGRISNISTALKNFYEVIDRVFSPKGVDLALVEAQAKIINEYAERDDVSEIDKLVFLSNYKRIIREYRNSENIIKRAAESIEKTAKPGKVDSDWYYYFFDKARLISDEMVQIMWAQILAGEVNTPGRYSRSLIHALSIMEKRDAEIFCGISRFCMRDYKKERIVHPMVFMTKNIRAYRSSKITAEGLQKMEFLGLIHCDYEREYFFKAKKVLRYGNRVIEIHGDNSNKNRILTGNVCLTDDGQALYDVVGDEFKEYNVDVLDFLIGALELRNCTVYVNNRRVTKMSF